jgi:hypothetical protein
VPNGKFTGPVKFTYAGDIAKAKSLSGYARTLIGNASNMAALGDVNSGWQKSTLPDGSVFLVNTQGSDPIAHIYVPIAGGKEGEDILFQYAFAPRTVNRPLEDSDPYSFDAHPPASSGHPTIMMDVDTRENRISTYSFHRYAKEFPGLDDPGYGNTFWTDGNGHILSWLADAGKYRSFTGSIFVLMDGYVIAQMSSATAGSVQGACFKDGYLFVVTRKNRQVSIPTVGIGGIAGVNSYGVSDIYVWAAPYTPPDPGKLHTRLFQSDFEEVLHVDMASYERCSAWARAYNYAADAGSFGFVSTFPDKGIAIKKDGSELTMITGQVHFDVTFDNSDHLYPSHATFYKHVIELTATISGPSAVHTVTELEHAGLLMTNVSYMPDYVRDKAISVDEDLSPIGLAGKSSKTVLAYDYDDVDGELHMLEFWFEDLVGDYQGSDVYGTVDGCFRRGVLKYRDEVWNLHEPIPGGSTGLWRVIINCDIRFGIFVFVNVTAEGTFLTIERYEQGETTGEFRELYRIQTAASTAVTMTSGYYDHPDAHPPLTTMMASEYTRVVPPVATEMSGGFATAGYLPWVHPLVCRSKDELIFQYTPAEVPVPNRIDINGNFVVLMNGLVKVFYDESGAYLETEIMSFDKIMRVRAPDAEDPAVATIIVGDMILIRDQKAEENSV